MNDIQTYRAFNPDGELDELTRIELDVSATLRLSNSLHEAGKYSIQFYIKSETAVTVKLTAGELEENINVSNEWNLFEFTFDNVDGDAVELELVPGTYYLHNVLMTKGEQVKLATIYEEPIVFGHIYDDMSCTINNASDDVIGIIIEITCKDEVVNPFLFHQESNEYLRISGTFKKDDILVIDTRQGKKSVTRRYNGDEHNIINSMSADSKWIKLLPAFNHLTQGASEGAENMNTRIIFTKEYGGV